MTFLLADMGTSLGGVADALSASVMFKSLPAIAANARLAFDMAAFVMLTASMIFKLRETGEHGHSGHLMKAILPYVLAAVFIAKIPYLINLTDKLNSAMCVSLGTTSQTEIVGRIYTIGSSLQPTAAPPAGAPSTPESPSTPPNPKDYPTGEAYAAAKAEFQAKTTGSSTVDTGWLARAKQQWEAVKGTVSSVASDIKSSFDASEWKAMFTKIIAVIICALLWLWLELCGVIINLFLTARYLLVHLCSILLPLFIACTVTQSFKQQGMNFILSVIGFIFWPLAWSIGHIGTLALGDWAIQYISTLFTTPGGGAGVGGTLAAGAVWTLVTGGTGPVFILILHVVTPILLLGIYALLVTVSAPFLIAKAITSGSAMFDSLIGGTAATAASLAGSALTATSMSMMQGQLAEIGSGGGGGGTSGSGGGEGGGGGSINAGNNQGGAAESIPLTGGDNSGGSEGGNEASSEGNASEGGNGGTSSGGGGRRRSGAVAAALQAIGSTLSNASKWNGDPQSFANVPDTGLEAYTKHAGDMGNAHRRAAQAARETINPTKQPEKNQAL